LTGATRHFTIEATVSSSEWLILMPSTGLWLEDHTVLHMVNKTSFLKLNSKP
jgi:hypothetical protein